MEAEMEMGITSTLLRSTAFAQLLAKEMVSFYKSYQAWEKVCVEKAPLSPEPL